jgi:hypothetical protein
VNSFDVGGLNQGDCKELGDCVGAAERGQTAQVIGIGSITYQVLLNLLVNSAASAGDV